MSSPPLIVMSRPSDTPSASFGSLSPIGEEEEELDAAIEKKHIPRRLRGNS